MTDPEEVRRFAAAIMTMIKEDQDSGQVPPGVSSLDELDDCVDIEDYLRQIGLPSGDHDAAALRDVVTAEVGRQLASTSGGPWHVVWKLAGGASAEIGRTVGYATQEEAEAVGREHVHTSGGGFSLRRA
jgi:hypothetical protein